MRIGGLQKFTLIDYPNKIAATVFTVGCNFYCPFCHNPELVLPEEIKKAPLIPEEEIFAFLKERNGFLEGVCISGGEPTLQPDLEDFIKKIKTMGFLVKLDTNGSQPEVLENLVNKNLVDYIAMDIKAPIKNQKSKIKNQNEKSKFKNKYEKLAGVEVDIKKIEESIEIIRKSSLNYEFRTTVVPNLLDEEDILEIGRELKGAERYVLQQFRLGKTIDPAFSKIYRAHNKIMCSVEPYSEEELTKFCQLLKPYFKICQVRI